MEAVNHMGTDAGLRHRTVPQVSRVAVYRGSRELRRRDFSLPKMVDCLERAACRRAGNSRDVPQGPPYVRRKEARSEI